MTNYKYSLYEQHNINPAGNGRAEWITTREIIKDSDRTERNIELSLSKDTMAHFRSMHSKQQVRRSKKNGKEIVKIFSYFPNDNNNRTVHEYREV